MGPTFSSKNGVRYRFYVSTALRGRKHKAGSVSRISAPEIENLVEAEVRNKLNADEAAIEELFGRIEHVTVSAGKIQITWEMRATTNAQLKSHGPPCRKMARKFSLHHLKQKPIRS